MSKRRLKYEDALNEFNGISHVVNNRSNFIEGLFGEEDREVDKEREKGAEKERHSERDKEWDREEWHKERDKEWDEEDASESTNHRHNRCKKFARILDGTSLISEPNLCFVTRERNINAEILGIHTKSPLAIDAQFSFETTHSKRKFLNLGQVVLLHREINIFIDALRDTGIKITALQNHWLFDIPRLYYINFIFEGDPLEFARNVAKAFDAIKILK